MGCYMLQGGYPSLPLMERDSSASSLSALSHSGSHKALAAAGKDVAAPPQLSEAERLAAAKSTKELVAKGITLFNTKGPLKGVEFLLSQGLLESSPAAVSR